MTHSFPTRRSSDLRRRSPIPTQARNGRLVAHHPGVGALGFDRSDLELQSAGQRRAMRHDRHGLVEAGREHVPVARSEEHTSELQSLMRISYAVFCLKKKTTSTRRKNTKRHY